MTNSSLVKKLKIKTGQLIAVINPPEGYLEELGSLPEGVDLSTKLEGRFDLVHLFVENSAQLGQLFPSVFQSLKEEGLFWISYPKGSSKIKSDLSRDQGWQPVSKAGLRAVSMVSINDTWSAVRFRKEQFTSSQEMVEVQYAGQKAALRPVYDRLVEVVQGFGSDVELAPRKSYVGLKRKKVFGLIKASTRTRIDLGLKLKGSESGRRLVEAPGFGSGSITHKVALTSIEDVDDEIISWMREAYEVAG